MSREDELKKVINDAQAELAELRKKKAPTYNHLIGRYFVQMNEYGEEFYVKVLASHPDNGQITVWEFGECDDGWYVSFSSVQLGRNLDVGAEMSHDQFLTNWYRFTGDLKRQEAELLR